MIRKLKARGLKWIDGVNLEKSEIYHILSKYNFHELDVEACLEENQRARIDNYDDYLFVVLHFPKYNQQTKTYELNEFNIFLGRDFLITLRNHNGSGVDDIFEKYGKINLSDSSDEKFSTGFILYEIIQSMLEKMFRVADNIKKDLKLIEKEVFEETNSSLVKQIMTKKRNIVVLKHMFIPQIFVMKQVEFNINKLFKGRIEEYFEDLEDKIEHIVNDIKILEEYTDSIEDAFKTMIDIKTNNVMTFLAIFSAFMLPLTFITSFYGMNIDLPFANKSEFIYLLLIFSLISMCVIYFYFKKKDRI